MHIEALFSLGLRLLINKRNPSECVVDNKGGPVDPYRVGLGLGLSDIVGFASSAAFLGSTFIMLRPYNAGASCWSQLVSRENFFTFIFSTSHLV